MFRPEPAGTLLSALAYTAMTSAVVSSLGMLLVPTIGEDMGVPVSTAQWMLTVNLLVGAVATPIMGRLSDGRAKKRLLTCSLATILLGSIVASMAPNFTVFLLGRALQGLAYGIVPVTIALARRHLRSEKVQPGISALSVTVSTGLGIGYPLTGFLAEAFGYRWAFGFGALFAASAIVVVWKVVPPDDHKSHVHGSFDILSALLLGSGLATLLVGVSEGPNWGWLSVRTALAATATVVLLLGWIGRERRVPRPLVNVRVFRRADVLVANLTALGLGAAMYIALSMVSLIAQAPLTTDYGFGLPLAWAGMMMVPLSAGSLGANRLVHLLTQRVGMTTALIIGVAVVTASTWSLWWAHAKLWQALIGMLVLGIGVGMTFAAMPALINRSVAEAGLGSAVSFNQVLRTIGGSLGSAVSGAVLAGSLDADLLPTEHGISTTLLTSAAFCTIVTLIVFLNRSRSSPPAEGE